MIRRPPRSTPFPTRRSSDLVAHVDAADAGGSDRQRILAVRDGLRDGDAAVVLIDAVRADRSEEHTSELQSQSNLVCRLLLEKKKNTHTEIVSEPYISTHHPG